MIMITIIIGLLSLLVCGLVLLCIGLKADNMDLKMQRDRAREMYRLESERNIEKLKEVIFRDDKDELLLNNRGV